MGGSNTFIGLPENIKKAIKEWYGVEMEKAENLEEVRFQIIKAMLEEFPGLRKRVREYLEREERQL